MNKRKLRIFQVDAFADRIFIGNPAAVVPLECWLDDHTMQSIALENNLSETAFFVRDRNFFLIRWFTPISEVKLCGHATLAAAHVIFRHFGYKPDTINFQTIHSGALSVSRHGMLLTMDFPSDPPQPCALPSKLKTAFRTIPSDCLRGKTDLLLVFDDPNIIIKHKPDFSVLGQISEFRGIIISAPGNSEIGADFISRFFAPAVGVNEDPVTGSAHTVLFPYWGKRLEKASMVAHQVSRRSGVIKGEVLGDRVLLSGYAVTYLSGEIAY